MIRKRSFASIFTRTIDLYFGIDLDRLVILLTILKRCPIESHRLKSVAIGAMAYI